jgi:fucose 4-O-acetylase-like acetyltransferase
MFLFIAMGYTGGVLSLVMQQHSILESPHFWTGTVVLGLLGLNGLISLSGFGGNQTSLRTVHAYLGSAALILLFVHAVLGINLGLSI